MPTIYVLIGPPASGKSTWREAYCAKIAEPTVVLSTDDLIEDYAISNGINYNEAFGLIDFSELEKKMFSNMRDAFANSCNVIVDRTNMSVKSRRRFLSNVPKNYNKIAVVFDIEPSLLFQRLNKRAKETGKNIPEKNVMSMIGNYQEPTLEEFDSIIIEKQEA